MIRKTAFIIIIAAISIAFLTIPVSALTNWTNVSDRWERVDGTFNVTKWNATGAHNWTVPAGVTQVQYLIVAGGGGGLTPYGGGAGAGGLLYSNLSVTAGQVINLTVGVGGINTTASGDGGNSTFGALTAVGGAGASATNGRTGGSGSGGGRGASSYAAGNGTAGQGFIGGKSDPVGAYPSGGGGGSSQAGQNSSSSQSGRGGNGTAISITGESIIYAAGGGGAGNTDDSCGRGLGGSSGVGGNGGSNATNLATNGTPETGSGGGSGDIFRAGFWGQGGSGIVIIRYASSTPAPISSFTITPSYNLTYPAIANVNDTSSNFPTNWSWNFGDTYTNTSQNTSHIFTVAGNYTITLNATNTGGSNSSTNTFNLSSDVDPFVKSWMHLNSSLITEDKMGLAWQKVGSADYSTATTKFGAGSLLIPGKSSYIYTPSSTNLDLGNNSGEIEFWVNMTTVGSARNMISRTSADGSGTTGGWGFYMDGSGNHGFWIGSLANETSTFTIPSGWHHIVVAIPSSGTGSNINIYRDGVIVANGTRPNGSYIVNQPLVIGGGGVVGGNPTYYINEFRYSIGTPRFTMSTFSPPYAQYKGDLNLSYPNINENATLLYKSYPSLTAAIVYNGSPRNRTPQVTDMINATSIQFSVNYNPAFERALTPVVNHTSYADINFTLITQDTVNGIERVNVFRDSGLGFTAPNGTRTNLVDLPIDYYNYTIEQNFTMGWENATITDGQHNITYPITHFLYTPVTYGEWTINTNFTASSTMFPVGNAVTFTDTSLGEPANWTQWNWSFGNGNYSTTQNPTYTYPAAGTYTVSLTSKLTANNSVTNTSTKVSYIQVTTAPGSVTGLTGTPASCTVMNFNWTNPTEPDFNGTMNWLNNVQQTNLSKTTTGITFTGLTHNAYTFSTKTFNNATPPQLNANYINVTNSTPWCSPIANFTATPTAGNFTFSVQFTDTSYNDPAVAWEWNFGDNSTNSTLQNPSHLYTYSGTFSPTLTIQNSTGFKNTLTRVGYITSTSGGPTNATELDIRGAPKLVLFRVHTLTGLPLANATVSIQGITTTAGTFDWVATLLGIPLDEAPIQNTLMTGTTDSLGELEFMMLPTTKYNITTTKSGYTFPPFYITPHDTEYDIVSNLLSGQEWIAPAVTNASVKNITITTVKYTPTNQAINVSYVDSSSTTTGGYINITQGTTTLQSYHIVSNSFVINQSVVVPIGGTSVKVSARILSSTGNVNKDYGITFSGPAVSTGGFDPQLVMWVSLFLIILTGLIAGATTSPQVSVIVCVEAWVFLAIGWLEPLVSKIGLDKVMGFFLFATFLCVIWNLREGKRKETGR